MSSKVPASEKGLAISLQDLGKKYPIYSRPGDKLLEWLMWRRKRFHREFWALRGLNLEVERGTSLGIIGQNGSGKSTLLQILAGILQPNEGNCQIEGKVAALLELGAGFNLEFSGLENVYLNATVLGLSRAQIDACLDRILEFAEIGDFIHQPVKTYSSGMFMRLAFAVAVHVDPEILLVDEALSVGDLIFQHRCIQRMRQLRDSGKTIVLVTHDLEAVSRFCDRALLLDGGAMLCQGEPEEVILAYRKLVSERERRSARAPDRIDSLTSAAPLPVVRTIPHSHNRYGDGGGRILGIILLAEDGTVLSQIGAGQKVHLVISIEFETRLENPIIGFTVRDRLGAEVTASNTTYEELPLPSGTAGQIQTVDFEFVVPHLRPGSYSISPALADGDVWEHTIQDWIDNAYIFDLVSAGLVYGQMKWNVSVHYSCHSGEEIDSGSVES